MSGRLTYWLDLLDRAFTPVLWPPACDTWINDPPPRVVATTLDNPPDLAIPPVPQGVTARERHPELLDDMT